MPTKNQTVPVTVPPNFVNGQVTLTAQFVVGSLNLSSVEVITTNAIPAGKPPSGTVVSGGTATVKLNSNDFQKFKNSFNSPGKSTVDITYVDTTNKVTDFEGFAK